MKSIEEIKESLGSGETEQNVGNSTFLFLDVSGTCTGYSLATIDFEKKKANFYSAGVLWLNPDWTHAAKYHYIGSAINNYFWVVEQIDYVVIEQYSMNPKKRMGTFVVPEMCGAIKAFAHENGLDVDSLPPQSWRSQLGIKKDKSNNDWKGPTKLKVLEVTDVPEKSISNITGNERTTPSDMYDAIAIGWGWLGKLGFSKITFNGMEFNKHLGVIQQEV